MSEKSIFIAIRKVLPEKPMISKKGLLSFYQLVKTKTKRLHHDNIKLTSTIKRLQQRKGAKR
jgi:hypothetical protein